MYGFFYPENGQRYWPFVEFADVEHAVAYWKSRRALWEEITPGGEDKAAFLNSVTGHVVVVRAIETEIYRED